MKNSVSNAVAAVALVLLLTPDAQAYIDPGTGSMVIQSSIAALIGIGFAFRNGVRQTLRWIGELFGKGSDPKHDEPPDEPKQ